MIAGSDNLIAIPFDPETSFDEWIESRRQGLGGSDVPAIVNEHPSMSAVTLWSDKTSGAVPFAGNERTETGRDLEPVVLGWFAQGGRKWPRSGERYTIVKPPSVYRRDLPWMRGSADGFVYYPEAIVDLTVNGEAVQAALLPRRPSALAEVKTHGWFGSKSYNLTDEGHPLISVPPDKRIQCAWYMALYEVETTYLVCLVDTHLKRTFALHRDLELESMLVDAADRFWREHVLADIPPLPDGSEGYSKFLANRWKTHSRDYVETCDEVDIATEALIAIKRDQNRLQDERELAEQVIKTHIGDHEGVRTARGNVSWKFQPSGKLREKDARRELYLVAGWTDDEIEAFEKRHQQPDIRMLRTPK